MQSASRAVPDNPPRDPTYRPNSGRDQATVQLPNADTGELCGLTLTVGMVDHTPAIRMATLERSKVDVHGVTRVLINRLLNEKRVSEPLLLSESNSPEAYSSSGRWPKRSSGTWG